MSGPACGHSACSQHYIDTGATACVAPDPAVDLKAVLERAQRFIEGFVGDEAQEGLPEALVRDLRTASAVLERLMADATGLTTSPAGSDEEIEALANLIVSLDRARGGVL